MFNLAEATEVILDKIGNAFTAKDVALLAESLNVDSEGRKKEVAERIIEKYNFDYLSFREKMKENVWKIESKPRSSSSPRRSSKTKSKTKTRSSRSSSYRKSGLTLHELRSTIRYQLDAYRPPTSLGASLWERAKIKGKEVILGVRQYGKWDIDEKGNITLDEDELEDLKCDFFSWVSRRDWYDESYIEPKVEPGVGEILKKTKKKTYVTGNVYFIVEIN